MRPHTLHPNAIQGKEGIKFCHLATLLNTGRAVRGVKLKPRTIQIPHGDRGVEEIVSGSGEFIRNESLSGAIMMLPWLRHLPFVRDRFLASKKAPLKMRKMQVKNLEFFSELFYV